MLTNIWNEEYIEEVELLRVRANASLDKSQKSTLGQYFTPKPICQFMASLFQNFRGEIKLLDPGVGPGSLTAAFIEEAIKRQSTSKIEIESYDIENSIKPYLEDVMGLCKAACTKQNIIFKHNHFNDDYIIKAAQLINGGLVPLTEKGIQPNKKYTHAIINPPYKKISSNSRHREALRSVGVETVNLYTCFIALAIKQLKDKGEIVAIIPRSFCNGPYYLEFRKLLLSQTTLEHIHIFDSRDKAFQSDEILQENIIIHLVKGSKQREVKITSSPVADFHFEKKSKTITATDLTTRMVPINDVVKHNDPQSFIYITTNQRQQEIVNQLTVFKNYLDDIGVNVSTGPVVQFRLKESLLAEYRKNEAPLLHPCNLANGTVKWPNNYKKPNAIEINQKSKGWLWKNRGYFVLIKRFSSKEEKRRIVATVYKANLPGELIGFENKLNVFHVNKEGFNQELAIGLACYLNSTILDKYYRLFGGHTQVNATDLKALKYPLKSILMKIGKHLKQSKIIDQNIIDKLIAKEIDLMSKNGKGAALKNETKIEDALDILTQLGMPKAQLNGRSALTLLALLNLKPEESWAETQRPRMGVTPIMDWCRENYGKEYAPNTRETFRRQTLHQFVEAGICLYNPDKLDRPVNSPKACYQITEELDELFKTYGLKTWKSNLKKHLGNRTTLVKKYAKKREMLMVPCKLHNGTEIKLSPGAHSELIRDIVQEFGARFAPGAEVLYLGDTGAKEDFIDFKRLNKLGVEVKRKGKLPDVVLYWPEKNWLLLIESVTSHGPVDAKRHGELETLFSEAKLGLVYVTAFPDRKTMAKYLSDISWETEVWTADAPTHMIHFNGQRFLGPYKK
jgi:adenine-specific DNA-methyltransferase